MACVTTTSKEFKSLASQYGTSIGTMELAIKSYLDKYSLEEYDPNNENFKDYINNYFKLGNTNTYSSKAEYDDTLVLWDSLQEILEERTSLEESTTIANALTEYFGEENIITFETDNGNYKINIAKPVLKDVTEKLTSENIQNIAPIDEISELQKSKNLVDRIIEDSNKRIKFNSENHTYTVDGKIADFSVTQYIRGGKEVNLGLWGLPSSSIGTTADVITRDFFSNSIKDSYSNMSKDQLSNLIDDLNKLRTYFDNRFGKGQYGVVTQEFAIASTITIINDKGKPEKKVIAGTMDMLIYDNKGNFYIYDMKTSRSGIKDAKYDLYTKQLNVYKNILEVQYPELTGKIKETKLINIKVGYPAPQDFTGNPTPYRYTQSGDQLYLNSTPIQDNEEYSSPRLSFDTDIESTLIELKQITFKEQFDKLPQDEKDLLNEEMIITSVLDKPYQQTEEERQKTALFDSAKLPAQERSFLADSTMKMASMIVTHLHQHPTANERYFPDGKYKDIDLTKMSRAEVLKTVDINDLLNIVKEQFFNTQNIQHISDPTMLEKLDLIYNNWGAFVEVGENKLMTLERVSLNKTLSRDSIKLDMGNEEIENENESGVVEEKPREYWQIGQRQISAKSGLSSEIRRVFEGLPVLNENGERVYDAYGYGIPLYVNSDVAVNSILDWVKDFTTIEEMEEVLNKMKASHPWVNSVIDKIQEEPFRSQFYTNFRKDFTNYSIITSTFDADGSIKYITTIINTKGAEQTILDELVSAFREGVMTNLIRSVSGDIEGRGFVNMSEIKRLTKLKNNIYETLTNASNQSPAKLKIAIKNSIPGITELLVELGVHVKPEVIETALQNDLTKRVFAHTDMQSILKDLDYILEAFTTQGTNKDVKPYNPLLKDSQNNVYSNYKNIVKKLSKYIQDDIESSTYENGKLYYSFNTPSYLQGLIKSLSNAADNIDKFENFIENNYGSYRWFRNNDGTWNTPWLDLITKNPGMRSALQHKVQLSFESNNGKKTGYEDLSELGYTLSILNEYFYDKTRKWAFYRVPTLSDKPSSEFIKFKRYNINYKRDITEGLKSVFNQEIMRIKTVLERAALLANSIEGQDNIQAIKNFDADGVFKKNPELLIKIKNGEKLDINDFVKDGKSVFAGTGMEFKFLDMFNQNIIDKDSLGTMIIDKINGDLSVEDEVLLDTKFRENLTIYMNKIVNKEISNWKQLGLFDTESTTKTIKGNEVTKTVYKYASNLGKDMNEIVSNLEEYVWNDMFASINIIQLTVTDLAYYKNVEDFQKRFAQVHSPAMKMNVSATDYNGVRYSKDGIERTIYLKDLEVISDIIPQVKQVLYDKVSEGSMSRFQADTILAKYGYSTTIDGKFIESVLDNGIKISILSEKINVADAQGYSSPTSYRKKMGMMGKWSLEMEEAYNKILSGDWNGEDLNVVWQPLKPFVYSQIRKSSGVSTMSELKVAVQNKNSEYLLIMADAILRGNKNENKLSAIYDFMEESAYTNGAYNGKGIDTVQFESAVKSGLMGVIDINKLSTVSEIKDALREAVYVNDEYDNQRVHEIAFEDYGIQQEVPAHLVDNEQLMGSQFRILSVSDISGDATFKIHKDTDTITAKQLVDEYQNLISQNIRKSFDKLIKDFNLTGNRLEKNKAISELLLTAMKNDQKYGPDLKYAISLNPQGEFNVPLGDPIHSVRIQQLLNSIIKTRINKQSVSGGPVVQTSIFGFSDDLQIVWKDGRIDYFEVYMPIPSSAMEEALTKEDGTLMSIDEALKAGVINEEQLKAIGYRIPTEDKYSMAPLRIKGFIPKSAGEVVILPKEITLLSGSDFDIDKLYIIIKDFLRTKKKVNYDKIKEALLKDETLQEMFKENKTIAFTDNIERIIEEIDEGVIFEEDTPEMYVFDYIEDNKSKFQEQSFYEIRNLQKTEGRNNRIFDIQWAVLTNQDTTPKMINPGSFDPQKRTARMITILKNPDLKNTYGDLANKSLDELSDLSDSTSGRNIVYSSTQTYLHKQNMTAGKLIGIFANNNTSHAFMSLQDIHLNLDLPFRFDGVEISNASHNRLDNILALDNKTLISKNIAGFLAASVDAVKDPVLNFMNLNTFTANPAMVLARLGFDSDAIGLFLTQPIIEKVTREYSKKSNEGTISAEDVIVDELKSMKDNFGIDTSNEDLMTNPFTKEEMAKNIALRANGIVNAESISYQVQALLLFKQLTSIGQDLNTLTFLTKFNSVTNAVGPLIADTFVMRERYKKFLDKMNDPFVPAPFSDNAVDVINNSSILKAFYETTAGDNGASQKIFENFFPHYSNMFLTTLGRFRQTTKSNLDSRLINHLINDFIVYKLTMNNEDGSDGVFNSSFEKRNHFINNFVNRFRKEAAGIIGNELIDVIVISARDNKVPVPTLQAKTGGYNADVQERIKDAWTTLVNNPKTKQLGIDLVFYNMFRSGFSFSPKTFTHLASVGVKQAVEGYIDNIADVKFNDEFVIPDEFLLMFRRNHSKDKRIVPELKKNNKIKPSFSTNVRNQKLTTFKFGENLNLMGSIIISGTSNYAPVITYNDNILIYESHTKDSVTYMETTTLGNNNNFLEYNANESAVTMKSVLLNPTIEQEYVDYTPTNNTVREDYFDIQREIDNVEALKVALENVLSQDELNLLAEYQDETKAEQKFMELMNDHLKVETSERHQEQLKKIIEKLC